MTSQRNRNSLKTWFRLSAITAAGICLLLLLATPFSSTRSFAKAPARGDQPAETQLTIEAASGSVDFSSLTGIRGSNHYLDLPFSSLYRRAVGLAAPIPLKDDKTGNAPLVAPPNDLCSGAEVIPGAGPFPVLTAVTADVTDATLAGDPPTASCLPGSFSRSIWYSFTPAANGNYLISSCADSPTASTLNDTIMAIYTTTGGCGGTLTELPTGGGTDGCDNDSCTSETFQSVITTNLNAGTQYFIVIWQSGVSTPTAGNTAVQLRVTATIPPPNDLCGSAVALTLNTPVTGTTSGAAGNYQLSGTTCFSGNGQVSSTAPGNDVAYSFTAPSAGTYSFRVTNYPSASDLVLYAATSCPAAGSVTCDSAAGPARAAANRNTSGTSEEVNCMSLTSGQQVFLFVDEHTASGGGPFTIEATRCTAETEPNDTPATADPMPIGVEGSIAPAADADFFNLGSPAPPAGSRVFAMVDGVAGNVNDFDLRITTTADTLEYDDTDCDTAFGSLSPSIAGRPLTGVASFIRINRFNATTVAEPYRLYATVQPPGSGLGGSSATAEAEPNNTTAQANANLNSFFSGSLAGPAPSTDVDMYSFTARAGELIFLSLDADPLRDVTPIEGLLALDDLNGTPLISVDDGATASSNTSGAGSLTAITPTSPSEGLVWRARYTGLYFARVAIGTISPTGLGAGDYLLSISRNGQFGPSATDGVVTGRIVDDHGNPVAGAVVRLEGTQNRKLITDANGVYRFDQVETNGFYTVTPSRANYNFEPSVRSFSQIGETTQAAFGATLLTSGLANPLDTPEYFVRQHYLDFLGREPDEAGFNFWSDQIIGCGGDATCIERRTINVSAAYFLSIEFSNTGGLVDSLYRASYGRAPNFAEFMPDTSTVANGVIVGITPNWQEVLLANKESFVNAWVARPAFQSIYGSMSNSDFVDTLISHSGGFNGNREVLVSGLNNNSLSRAQALRQIADNEGFVDAKRNEMFVRMQYFGYLRRDPDAAGFNFWLNKLNQFNGNFEQAEMVKAFLVSGEYRNRFQR